MSRIVTSVAAAALMVTLFGCRRDEEGFVRDTVTKVGAASLVTDASATNAPRTENEFQPVDLTKISTSFAAFEPVEVLYCGPDSYLIVTARWLQHRTGVYISRPGEIVPKSTKHLTYNLIAPRVYFYQD